MVPFWVPIIIRGLIRGQNLRDPKGDHNFDHPPFGMDGERIVDLRCEQRELLNKVYVPRPGAARGFRV